MALRYVFGWLSHAGVATSVRRSIHRWSGGAARTKGQTVDMSQELVRDLIERAHLLEHLVGQLRRENNKLREALRAANRELV